MTHTIAHPIRWPLLDELHTHLWKRFPMARFEFVADPEARLPKYVQTLYGEETEETRSSRRRNDEIVFFEEVEDAVREFLAEEQAA